MLELLKEMGFIPESRAVKLYCLDGKVVGERFDRVTYMREVIGTFPLEIQSPIYVEAGRFLPLVPFIDSANSTENYLHVLLKNGAEYKIPYLEGIEFSRPQFSDDSPQVLLEGKIDLSALKKTTLQNLVKPEMRCIYMDERGSVSCNFLQATVDKNLRSPCRVLLSPDIIDYIPVSDSDSIIASIGDYLFYTDTVSRWIWAPKAEIEEVSDGEIAWYDTMYNLSDAVPEDYFVTVPPDIEGAIKRLSFFSDEAEFMEGRIVSGQNYEPLSLPQNASGKYTLEELGSVISIGKQIAFYENALFLRNDKVTVIVSEKEDD